MTILNPSTTSTDPRLAADANPVDGPEPSVRGGRLTRDEIQELKQRDNITNFGYIAGIYVIVAVTAVAGVVAWEAWRVGDLSGWWLVPITIACVLSMGASQHQFGAVIHEATHYMLFENRKLNELASDWLAGFPIYTSTQAYRLHHFAHHQFVNDPDRDPIATQAAESGHWLDFPVTHVQLAKGFFRLILPTSLIRYMVSRAKHSALPQESNPFSQTDAKANPWATRVGILFAVGLPVALIPVIALEWYLTALILTVIAWAAMVVYYIRLPDDEFPLSQIKTVISDRATIIGRMSYLGAIYAGLSLICLLTGAPAWGYYALFWLLPLFTAFPVFMVLREWVQHGNADRGRMTNSRVFLVDPISRYAVFPLGMDYHLPHHLYASVPHYNLKTLHEKLSRDPQYQREGRIVEGWFGHNAEGEPSITEVLGPAHQVRGAEIYVDDDTLEHAEVRDAQRLKQHATDSRSGRIW